MGEDLPQATRCRRLTVALVIALGCASLPVDAHAWRYEPAPGEGAPAQRGWAHVAVDTSAIGEAGPVVRRRVQERADVVLRRAGIMPGRGPQDPTISVVIREVEGDEPGWAYVLKVERADQPGTAEEHACPLCTETELVDAIEGRLATIAAGLEASETAASDDPVADPEPTVREPPPRPAEDTSPRGLGRGGKAGIALMVLGGASLVAGVVLVVLPDRPKPGDPTHEIFTQPPGYAMLGVGAASLVVGAVLFGVDRRRARRTGKQARFTGPGLAIRF